MLNELKKIKNKSISKKFTDKFWHRKANVSQKEKNNHMLSYFEIHMLCITNFFGAY
jgi:hypothetical protein